MSSIEKINTEISESKPSLRLVSDSSKSRGPNYGLLVTLTAQAGKQDQVAAILSNALNAAAREPGTLTWYAYRITDTKFGIFDTFQDETAREAHLNGEIAKVLGQVSAELLEGGPQIQPLSVVASKI